MKSEIEQHTYLTKRILLHATGKAIRETSARAMEMVGYLIRVDNGWIVKETADGEIIRLKKLPPAVRPKQIILD